MITSLCNKTFNKMREQYPCMTSGDLQTLAVFCKLMGESDLPVNY